MEEGLLHQRAPSRRLLLASPETYNGGPASARDGQREVNHAIAVIKTMQWSGKVMETKFHRRAIDLKSGIKIRASSANLVMCNTMRKSENFGLCC